MADSPEVPVPAELVDHQVISSRTLRKVVGGISRRTLCKWIQAKLVPKPKLFAGANYWRVKVIRAWLIERFGDEEVARLDEATA
jgi:hypothetical protein